MNEKQIEEMALDICKSRGAYDGEGCERCCMDTACLYKEIANALHTAGYRKQKDVVPREEVAKIFEEIESVLFTVANPCPSADGTIIVKHSNDFHLRREDYYTIKEKYI